ncbi:MAG: hypothetical protein J5I94_25015 [Phaeodactylibacter sp.]|nr:hypothetical protein [Phaeodactylibacter sp.]
MKNALYIHSFRLLVSLLIVSSIGLLLLSGCNQESTPTPSENGPTDDTTTPIDNLAGIDGTYNCTCYIENLGYGDEVFSKDTVQQEVVIERANQSQDTIYLNNTEMVNTLKEPNLVFSVPYSSLRYKYSGVFYLEQDSLKVYFYQYYTKTYYCYGTK